MEYQTLYSDTIQPSLTWLLMRWKGHDWTQLCMKISIFSTKTFLLNCWYYPYTPLDGGVKLCNDNLKWPYSPLGGVKAFSELELFQRYLWSSIELLTPFIRGDFCIFELVISISYHRCKVVTVVKRALVKLHCYEIIVII